MTKSLVNDNWRESYRRYIHKKWEDDYFDYESYMTRLAHAKTFEDLTAIEKSFVESLSRLLYFAEGLVRRHTSNKQIVVYGWTCLPTEERHAYAESALCNAENVLKMIFGDTKYLKDFVLFNKHFILSFGAALDHQLSVIGCNYKGEAEPLQSEVVKWGDWESYKMFKDKVCPLEDAVVELQNECLLTYSSVTETSLESSAGLLQYPPIYTPGPKETYDLGFLSSLAMSLVLLVFLFAGVEKNAQFNLFTTNGIFVYTAVGNFLLFQLTWTINVLLWDTHHVNYVSIIKLKHIMNQSKRMHEVVMQIVFYSISLLFFYQTNNQDSRLFNQSAGDWFPVGLLIVILVYQPIRHVRRKEDETGLLSSSILIKIICAPFHLFNGAATSPTFRDIYCADVLTSFSKVITDSMHGMCWIVQDVFEARKSSDDLDFCASVEMDVLMTVVVGYTLLIRAAQCVRKLIETGQTYPHLYNTGKYFSNIICIIYGFFFGLDSVYIGLVIFSTLYKWVWDVRMDWGLWDFSDGNTENMFLRKKLMFGSANAGMYYVCIVVDLVLRFLWILSLRPSLSYTLLGPLAGTFLASLEILRRCMWGVLRVEWEHVKTYTGNNKLRVKVLLASQNGNEQRSSLHQEGQHRVDIVRQGVHKNTNANKVVPVTTDDLVPPFPVHVVGDSVVAFESVEDANANADTELDESTTKKLVAGQYEQLAQQPTESLIQTATDFESILTDILWGGAYTE